jgi:two-component system, NarL family, nitrate/nitrite response regulator NarL
VVARNRYSGKEALFVLRPVGSGASLVRTGGMAVEGDVALDQAVACSRDGRALRIVVVWGVRFAGESLAEILERDPLVSVVGLCSDLSEAVTLNPAVQADVVLLDARIVEGAAAAKRALDAAPGMRIVVAAVREIEDDIVAWAEAGVIGYIPKTVPLGDFVRLIMDIHSGEQICSGRVAAGLLRRLAHTGGRSPGRNALPAAPALTRRERQIAELLRSELSDKEIARRLNISLATTKCHVHNLLGKLNLRRRGQVAQYLREHEAPRSSWVVSRDTQQPLPS